MKLSKRTRQAILAAALEKSGVNDRRAAIKTRYGEWAEAARVCAVPVNAAKILGHADAVIEVLPKNLEARVSVRTARGIDAIVAGQRRIIYWTGAFKFDDAAPMRICPLDIVIRAGSVLADQLHAIDADAEKLAQEVEQLTVSIMAVLNSVQTEPQLIKVWPEAAEFLPAAVESTAPQLPALQIAELNKMIGLAKVEQ